MQSIVDLVWAFMASLQFTSFLATFFFIYIQAMLWGTEKLNDDNTKIIPIICGVVLIVFSTCFLVLM